jgi:hypothetical protein
MLKFIIPFSAMPRLNTVSRLEQRYPTRTFSKASNVEINPTSPVVLQQTFTAENTKLRSSLAPLIDSCSYADYDLSWFLANGVLPTDVETCQLGIDMTSTDKSLPVAALTPVKMPGKYTYSTAPGYFNRFSFSFYSAIMTITPDVLLPHSLRFNGSGYATWNQPIANGRQAWQISFIPNELDSNYEYAIFSSYTSPSEYYWWYINNAGLLAFSSASGSASFPIVNTIFPNDINVLSWSVDVSGVVNYCCNGSSSLLLNSSNPVLTYDPDTAGYGSDGQIILGAYNFGPTDIYPSFVGKIGRVIRMANTLNHTTLDPCAVSNSNPTVTPPIAYNAICDFYEGSGTTAQVQVGSQNPESFVLLPNVEWDLELLCYNPCNIV